MVSTKYRRKEARHEERNTCLCCEEMQEKERKSEGNVLAAFPPAIQTGHGTKPRKTDVEKGEMALERVEPTH
jgi:hypothetical protein